MTALLPTTAASARTRALLADMPETTRLAETIQTWWPAIEAFLRLRITNARTEGANRVIKQIKRVGCGYRNQSNYERRILTPRRRQERGMTQISEGASPSTAKSHEQAVVRGREGTAPAAPPTETATITAPTLIIWGDRDGLLTREDQEALSAAIPGSRLVVYEDTGHLVLWEQPERVATDLTAFVVSLKSPNASN